MWWYPGVVCSWSGLMRVISAVIRASLPDRPARAHHFSPVHTPHHPPPLSLWAPVVPHRAARTGLTPGDPPGRARLVSEPEPIRPAGITPRRGAVEEPRRPVTKDRGRGGVLPRVGDGRERTMHNEPTDDGTAQPDPPTPATQTSSTGTNSRRRRGPGPFTLIVLPGVVTLSGVFVFLSLAGVFDTAVPQDQAPQGAESSVSKVDGSYVPWLRRATADCPGITPRAPGRAHRPVVRVAERQRESLRAGPRPFHGSRLEDLGPGRRRQRHVLATRRDRRDHGAGAAGLLAGGEDDRAAHQGNRQRGGRRPHPRRVRGRGGRGHEGRHSPPSARDFVTEVQKRRPQYDALVQRNPEQESGQAAGPCCNRPSPCSPSPRRSVRAGTR